jgi:hypothetical protein
VAALLQRVPILWRTAEFVRAIGALHYSEDRPYLRDMLTAMLRVAPDTAGGPRLVNLFRLATAVDRRLRREGGAAAIVECGVARGGSIVYYASLLQMMGRGGRVIRGVDGVCDAQIRSAPMAVRHICGPAGRD